MRELPGVLLNAGRLLARHWPALLTLAFAGAAVRSGVLWAAVEVSDHQAQLAQLLLILAPLGYLLPIIVMLRLCRGSLPRLSELARVRARDTPSEHRPERLVDIAASVLVLFLALYVSYGLLDQDIARFRNEAAYAEFSTGSLFASVDQDYAGRLGIYPVGIALAIVVGAWLLRWGLGLAERRTHLLALAYVGALVEVYYTAQLAGQTLVLKTSGLDWIQDRQAVHWFESGYDAVLDALGFLAGPADAVFDAAQAVIGSWQEIVVVPLAWLGVGAVVLGHKLADKEAAEEPTTAAEPVPTHVVARLVRSFLADLRTRWSAVAGALRLLASAGLLPMLAFSLVLLVVVRASTLFAAVSRGVIGPISTDTFLAIAPIESALGMAVSMALTAPLVAAAVDWLVAAREERDLRERADRRSPVAPTTPVPS